MEFNRKLEKCPDSTAKMVFSINFIEKPQKASFSLLKSPSNSEFKIDNSFQFFVKDQEENESFNGINVWQALENLRHSEKRLEDELIKKNTEIEFLKGELEIKNIEKGNKLLDKVLKKISGFLLENEKDNDQDEGNIEKFSELNDILNKFKEIIWKKLENKKSIDEKNLKEEIQELKTTLKDYQDSLEDNRLEREDLGLKCFEFEKEKDDLESLLKKTEEKNKDLMSRVLDIEKKLKKTTLEVQILTGEKEAFELERTAFQRNKLVFENQVSDQASKMIEMTRKLDKSIKELEILKKEKEAIECEKEELHKMFETHNQELKNSLNNALLEMKTSDHEYQVLFQEKEALKQTLGDLEILLSEQDNKTKELNLEKNKALLEISVLQREKNAFLDRFSLEKEEAKKTQDSLEIQMKELSNKMKAIIEENERIRREKEEIENREKMENEELMKNKEILKKLMMEIESLNNEKDNMDLKESSEKELKEGLGRQLSEEKKKVEDLMRKVEILEREIVDLMREKAEILEKLTNFELKLKEETKKVKELEDKFDFMRVDNENLKKEREKLENERVSEKEILEQTKENLMINLVEIEELKMEIETLQKEAEDFNKKNSLEKQAFHKAKEALERQDSEQNMKIGRLLMEFETLQKEREDLLKENEDLKKKATIERLEFVNRQETLEHQLSELKELIMQEHESQQKEKDSFEQKVSYERKQSFKLKDTLENEVSMKNNEIKELHEKNEELNKELQDFHERKYIIEIELSDKNIQIKDIERTIKDLQINNEALEIQVSAFSNDIKDLLSQIETLKQYQNIDNLEQKSKDTLETELSNHSPNKSNPLIEEAMKTIENLQQEKASFEAQIKTLNSDKSQLKSRVNFLIDEKNLLKIRVSDLEKQAESLNNYLNLTLSEASELQKNQFFLDKNMKKTQKSLFIFKILSFCLRKFCYRNTKALNQENKALKSEVFSLNEKLSFKEEEIEDLNSRLISKELDNTYLIEEMLILKEEMEEFKKSEKKLKVLIFCQIFFKNLMKFNIKSEFSGFSEIIYSFLAGVQKVFSNKMELTSKRLEDLTTNFAKLKRKVLELTEDNERMSKENEDLKSLTISQKLALKNHLELQKKAMFLERQLKVLTDSLENEASLEKKGLLFEILQEKSTIKTQNDKIKEMEERVSRLLSKKSKTSNNI